MARTTNRLSATRVATLKAPGYYADGGNLYFRVAPAGSKGWIFRFAMRGKTRDMGLGPYPATTLAKARQKAASCRELVADGVDPVEQRKSSRMKAALAQARGVTFRECATAYVAAHEAGWRHPKHRAQWHSSLRNYIDPALGPLSVQDVDVGLVMRILEPIWAEKPETAGRVRGRIEAILDWAKARGYRDGENPARWKGHLDHLLPARSRIRRVRHYAALPYDEVGRFMEKLRDREGVVARALEFAILTASRTGEVLGMRWGEVAGDVWTIPAERMKSGREHRVPLSARAIAILRAVRPKNPAADDLVFPGARGDPLSDMALARVHHRMGYDITTHGFRSAFKDWASERTSFPNEVSEAALAHVVGDRVEAAYRRGDLFDKRRRLMDAWAQFCATAKDEKKVVPIGKAVK